MDDIELLAQKIIDGFGLIYRNLIRDENDSVSAGSNSQSAILSVLLRTGPAKMSEISRLLKVTKPNITFLVDRMEEQGFISRENDPRDRRVINIRLTDRGTTEIERQKKHLRAKVVSRLERLSTEDRRDLDASLDVTAGIVGKLYIQDERSEEL